MAGPPKIPITGFATPQSIRRALNVGGITFVPVDPRDKLCFIYSVGMHQQGLPELFAIDVPRAMVQKATYLLGLLVEAVKNPNKAFHGYKFESENLWLETLHVTKESQRKRIIRSMGHVTSTKARIIMVKPLWDVWETTAPPTIKQETILGKWRQYREEHPQEPSSYEMPRCYHLQQALRGSDWKLPLTSKQIKYVENNKQYMMQTAFSELCFPNIQKGEAFLEDVAANIHMAPERYPLGVKVAQGNYTWEI